MKTKHWVLIACLLLIKLTACRQAKPVHVEHPKPQAESQTDSLKRWLDQERQRRLEQRKND